MDQEKTGISVSAGHAFEKARNASLGPEPNIEPETIRQAVKEGIVHYIASRKEKVPSFVETHFSFTGALRLHRKAFGRDLYRAPVNVLLAVPAVALRSCSWLLGKVGLKPASDALARIPTALVTDVQNEVNWLIYTELLELPYRQGHREYRKDALFEYILSQPCLTKAFEPYLRDINRRSLEPAYRRALARNLEEYAVSRTAAADLANSLITLSSGYAAFHQATPGVLAGGSALAGAVAQQVAISHFWLGHTLGSWYYAIFPATASTGLLIAATGSVMAALALLSTFTGIVTDPVQAKLGLHKRRLFKFLDALQDELLGTKSSDYRIKDQYVARIFDLFDLLRTAVAAR